MSLQIDQKIKELKYDILNDISDNDHWKNDDREYYTQINVNLWKTLEHNGVYIYPKITLLDDVVVLYDGKQIPKTDCSYEILEALFYYKRDKKEKDEVYMYNFINSFYELDEKWNDKYGDFYKLNLDGFDEIIVKYLEDQKNIDYKKIAENYSKCIVDGKEETLRGFKTEEPTIFRGAGDKHPKRGTIRNHIYAHDVTINTSNVNNFPKPNYGTTWKKIITRTDREFVCSWYNKITGKVQYIYLNRSSTKEQLKDKFKFDDAIKLGEFIDDIRIDYKKMIDDRNEVGLVLYLLDNFSFRIGNEPTASQKGSDTYGITTIPVESLVFNDETTSVEFSFIGKSSILYFKTHVLEKNAYDFLKSLTMDKTGRDSVFSIKSEDVNVYLRAKTGGITAKSFRTRNSSLLMSELLNSFDFTDLKTSRKLTEFKTMNVKVADICNHKKLTLKDYTEDDKEDDDKLMELVGRMELEKDEISRNKLKEKIKNMQNTINTRRSTRDFSLSTSKINYIDPRIVFKWLYQNTDIPVSKIYTKTTQNLFSWATDDLKDNPKWFFS
jgi:DNA topoisomerase-1